VLYRRCVGDRTSSNASQSVHQVQFAIRSLWLQLDSSCSRSALPMTTTGDVFLLDTFPLRYISLVGVLVGIDARERQTVFLRLSFTSSP
jgi:hypothetical protein